MLKTVKKMISQLTSVIGESSDSSKNQPSISEESGYYVWSKGDNISLSKYFSTREFTCQCNLSGCDKQKISKELITKLDQIRETIKQPLVVTSGFRCKKHQAEIRASGVSTVVAKLSQHELGNAADIRPKNEGSVGLPFLQLCEKYFDSIGTAKTFLHVDLRKGIRRWNY